MAERRQKGSGLRRQIVLSMMVLAFSVVLLAICGSYVFYAIFMTYSPTSISDGLVPAPAELTWMAMTMLAALVLATGVAVRLARRILAPLNSVADNLRLVAEGDLSARAIADEHSMGEATRLVSDFNNLAERLERMARDRAFWNAAIAHELRTPVTVLRGRLQGLAEGVFQPSPQLALGLLSQVEGLSRLVEDLRLLSLDESGRLALQLEQCDLAAEIRSTVNAFEPTLRAAGFTLSLELGEFEAICDPVRMRQALLALLDNAVHHASPGPLRIRLFESAGMAHLEVEDTGPGIPVGLIERVFEAFHSGQGDGSGRGSGLGLAVVKALARAHGGDAMCRASGTGGTVFELVWPT
ncbi:ATP-binding protein [Nitrospirillum pindoramense]|uniref:histidine kinase n=1 Tax=Nitrospirillum amazonense TaxID=28077 RepID=A0A560HE56_9PROT|nr:ATP-binding protein [Nitrospirillum amazonense]TWB43949.1 two-component system sensor histidine kinase AdeS [Nitrospirillum amazonense]